MFPLNISVFNYVDQDLPIRVELFVKDNDIKAEKTEVDMCVKGKNNHVESLKVSALELGEVNITVKATIKNDISIPCSKVSSGEGFSDALVKPLRVKPEGVPVEIVKSDFKCIESGTDSFDLDRLELPDNLVEGSDRAYLHVTGDVMAPALENVGNLVRLPTGCGEQNMVMMIMMMMMMMMIMIMMMTGGPGAQHLPPGLPPRGQQGDARHREEGAELHEHRVHQAAALQVKSDKITWHTSRNTSVHR